MEVNHQPADSLRSRKEQKQGERWSVATIAAHFHPLPAGLAALGRGQNPVLIRVQPVDPRERALAHLVGGDEALLAEQAHRATVHAVAAPLAATLAKLDAGLVELGARDAAVVVEIKALEPPLGASAPPLLGEVARLLRRGTAILVEIETGEPLVDPFDHLITADIGVAIGARGRLGESGAGSDEHGCAGKNG